MGSRSMGELLLGPASLSRLSFQTSTRTRVIAPSWSSRRTITNSSSSHSAQPQPKPQGESEQSYTPQPDSPQPASSQSAYNPLSNLGGPSSARPARRGSEQTSKAIDDLFGSMNDSRYSRATNRVSPSSSSADEAAAARTSRVFGSQFSDPQRAANFRRKPLQFDDMLMPDGLPKDVQAAPKPVEVAEADKNYPRLTPSYGRVVDLAPERGRDLVRGIAMLGSLMSRNKVRADFMKQRYHERAGMKRKRLKSERWRARFKQGFNKVTTRVTELTRKGW